MLETGGPSVIHMCSTRSAHHIIVFSNYNYECKHNSLHEGLLAYFLILLVEDEYGTCLDTIGMVTNRRTFHEKSSHTNIDDKQVLVFIHFYKIYF